MDISELLAFVGKPMWDAETCLVREADILRYQEALGDTMIVRELPSGRRIASCSICSRASGEGRSDSLMRRCGLNMCGRCA